MKDLQEICSANGANYIEFSYDWRIDLLRSAALLGDPLNTVVEKDRATRVTLVCHSMGGLVARILLESTGSGSPPKWKDNVKRLLCICTPHLGAPKSLAMCMGLEGETTITARDVKTLCDSTDYPAAYQLLPPELKVFVWVPMIPDSKNRWTYTRAQRRSGLLSSQQILRQLKQALPTIIQTSVPKTWSTHLSTEPTIAPRRSFT